MQWSIMKLNMSLAQHQILVPKHQIYQVFLCAGVSIELSFQSDDHVMQLQTPWLAQSMIKSNLMCVLLQAQDFRPKTFSNAQC